MNGPKGSRSVQAAFLSVRNESNLNRSSLRNTQSIASTIGRSYLFKKKKLLEDLTLILLENNGVR